MYLEIKSAASHTSSSVRERLYLLLVLVCQSFGLMVSLLTAELEYITMICDLIREARRDE